MKYTGPENPGPRENPYVFMIFKQAGHLTVPATWRNKMQRKVNFTELTTDWHLTGTNESNKIGLITMVFIVSFFDIRILKYRANIPCFEAT